MPNADYSVPDPVVGDWLKPDRWLGGTVLLEGDEPEKSWPGCNVWPGCQFRIKTTRGIHSVAINLTVTGSKQNGAGGYRVQIEWVGGCRKECELSTFTRGTFYPRV